MQASMTEAPAPALTLARPVPTPAAAPVIPVPITTMVTYAMMLQQAVAEMQA